MKDADRASRLKRLAQLQRKVESIARMELGELSRERAAVAERMTALVEALASPDPIHSGFSKLYGGQLGRLKLFDQQLSGRIRIQEGRVSSERSKADRLDDGARRANELQQREAQDNAVYDILDMIGGLDAQASRKLRRP
jgi:hypothetical protein